LKVGKERKLQNHSHAGKERRKRELLISDEGLAFIYRRACANVREGARGSERERCWAMMKNGGDVATMWSPACHMVRDIENVAKVASHAIIRMR
jgi:hypothetical protein